MSTDALATCLVYSNGWNPLKNVTNTLNFCSSIAKYGSFSVNERSPTIVKGPGALFKPNKGLIQFVEWGQSRDS